MAAYSEMRAANAEQKKKIADLQANLAKYQNAATEETDTAKLLKADLLKANLLAGTVAVSGPGVVITLRDSKNPPRQPEGLTPEEYAELVKMYIIHDADIQLVLNELKSAGAEAIAINDQRVVAMTAVRCGGSIVYVNKTETNASPVRIKAIGDPDTLVSSLTMTGGIQGQYAVDPEMFSIDKAKNLTLPAYAGATPLRYAKVAAEAKAEQAQKQSENAAGAKTP
jgi:uncharacterized protein YlxW (UPF0749 family)